MPPINFFYICSSLTHQFLEAVDPLAYMIAIGQSMVDMNRYGQGPPVIFFQHLAKSDLWYAVGPLKMTRMRNSGKPDPGDGGEMDDIISGARGQQRFFLANLFDTRHGLFYKLLKISIVVQVAIPEGVIGAIDGWCGMDGVVKPYSISFHSQPEGLQFINGHQGFMQVGQIKRMSS